MTCCSPSSAALPFDFAKLLPSEIGAHSESLIDSKYYPQWTLSKMYAMRDIGIGARSSDEVLRDKEHNIHCISSFLHIDLRIDLKLDNLHHVLMPCLTLVLARAPPPTKCWEAKRCLLQSLWGALTNTTSSLRLFTSFCWHIVVNVNIILLSMLFPWLDWRTSFQCESWTVTKKLEISGVPAVLNRCHCLHIS